VSVECGWALFGFIRRNVGVEAAIGTEPLMIIFFCCLALPELAKANLVGLLLSSWYLPLADMRVSVYA